jgi:hypothetical protein
VEDNDGAESKKVETYIGSGRGGFSKTVDPMKKINHELQ